MIRYKNDDIDNTIILQEVVRLLKQISDGLPPPPPGGLATEPTLLLVNSALDLLTTTVNGTSLNSLVQFDKDGTITNVIEDSVTPSNNTPLPVKITSTAGDINITAGDLNVQLSASGTNFDSVRIGDGNNLLTINSDGSLNVITKEEDRLARYAISRDDSSTTTEYYGFTATDGNWYIMQIDTINGEYKYANGSSDFLTNWGDRTILVYAEFETLTW